MKYIQVAVFLINFLAIRVFADTTPSVEGRANRAAVGEFQEPNPEVFRLREKMSDTSLGFRDRYFAAGQLLAQGDEQVVRQLVYGLKTGDIFSAQVLMDHAPLLALAYMVEDIDHGIPTNIIGADDPGDVYYPSVKDFATQIALKSLASSKMLPEPTLRFFNHLSEINDQRSGYFNDEFADIIVEWWSHNKDSLSALRYGDATWLPDETPAFLTREEKNPNPPPPPAPPPPPTPTELTVKNKIVMDETFEEWVDRVVVRKEIKIFQRRNSHPAETGREGRHDSHLADNNRNALLDEHGLSGWINPLRLLALISVLMVAVGGYRFFKAGHKK